MVVLKRGFRTYKNRRKLDPRGERTEGRRRGGGKKLKDERGQEQD